MSFFSKAKELGLVLADNLIYPYLLVDQNMAKITARIKDSENISRGTLINDIKIYSV